MLIMKSERSFKNLPQKNATIKAKALLKNDSPAASCFTDTFYSNRTSLSSLQNAEEEKLTQISHTYQDLLNQTKPFSLSILYSMCEATTNLSSFRLPYTIANIFRHCQPTLRQAIDNLIVGTLIQLAKQTSEGGKSYQLLHAAILNSALRKGIINLQTKRLIQVIGISSKALSEVAHENLMPQLKQSVVSPRQPLQHLENLAAAINDLNTALRYNDYLDLLCSIATVGLALLNLKIIDEEALVTDLADLSEITPQLFIDLPPDSSVATLSQLYREGKLSLCKKAVEVLTRIDCVPDNFICLWINTTLTLQIHSFPLPLTPPLSALSKAAREKELSLATENPVHFNSSAFTIKSKSARTSKQQEAVLLQAIKADNLAEISDILMQGSALNIVQDEQDENSPTPRLSKQEEARPFRPKLSVWLAQLRNEGKFTLSMNKTKVIIQFLSTTKKANMSEEIIFILSNRLKQRSDFKNIIMRKQVVKGNRLILTATTLEGAEKIKRLLENKLKLSSKPWVVK